MYSRIFNIFYLSLMVSTPLHLSGAMDAPMHMQEGTLPIQAKHERWFHTVDKEMRDLYRVADNTPSPDRRVYLFANVVERVDEALPTINAFISSITQALTNTDRGLSPAMKEQLAIRQKEYANWKSDFLITKALSLGHIGAAIHNIHARKIPPSLEHLKGALNYISESSKIYKSIKAMDFYNNSRISVADAMESLGMAGITQADKEPDPQKSLTLFAESLDYLEKSNVTAPSPEREKHIRAGKMIFLTKVLSYYSFIDTQASELYKQQQKTIRHYKEVIDLTKFTDQLVNCFDRFYINSAPLDFQLIPLDKTKNKMEKVSRKGQGQTKGSKQRPSQQLSLDREDFRALLYSIYCGLLKEAHGTTRSIAEESQSDQMQQLYVQKAEEHLDKAAQLYRSHFYQNDYAENPEREQSFILACIDDLKGNAAPLSEFYRALHQANQEEKPQEQVSHKLLAEKNKQEEAEAEPKEEADSGKPSQGNLIKKEPQAAAPLVKTPSGPSSPLPLAFAHPTKDAIIRRAKGPAQKATNMRRNLPYASPILPKKVKTPALSTAPKKEKIGLSSADYTVFSGLVGKIYNRSISLGDVKKLLTSLGCTIETGKGSHQKAIAKNGQIWTLPREWDGPIPHYYRHQLNDFLQRKMAIISELVSIRK